MGGSTICANLRVNCAKGLSCRLKVVMLICDKSRRAACSAARAGHTIETQRLSLAREAHARGFLFFVPSPTRLVTAVDVKEGTMVKAKAREARHALGKKERKK